MTDKVAAEGLIASPASQVDLDPIKRALEEDWVLQLHHANLLIAEIERLRAEVSSPARPPLAKIALADDIIEQVQRHYAGSGPLPTKGSTTVYADAQMVLAALAEGAVSAAPPALKQLIATWRQRRRTVADAGLEKAGKQEGIEAAGICGALELCADELETALADLARLRAPREENGKTTKP